MHRPCAGDIRVSARRSCTHAMVRDRQLGRPLDVELRLEVIPPSNFSSWRLAGGLLITETYAADLSEEPL